MNAALRVLVILVGCGAMLSSAAADDATGVRGMLDTVLEKLDVKAKPADPAPDFIRKTRPDATGLDYIQRPVPHKVSPVPTKTPDEVEAMKAALDQARERQLNPVKPPLQIDKGKKASSAKPPS